jgi:hypothetical protein
MLNFACVQVNPERVQHFVQKRMEHYANMRGSNSAMCDEFEARLKLRSASE